jgi:hypothetical protein
MAAKDPAAAFAALDAEFRRLHEQGLFEGSKTEQGRGRGKPVKVRADAARKQRFSKQSIRLAEESAAFTNALVASLSDEAPAIDLARARDQLRHYPTLARYFEAAAQVSAAASAPPQPGAPPTEASVAPAAPPTTEGGDQPADSASAQGLIVDEVFKRWACGWFTNPKPPFAAGRHVYYASDPMAELRQKGYHNTVPGADAFNENDWTRSQTWHPEVCGLWTFRDHANIRVDGTSYREQSYVGWSPPGEPNPELYLSGPWPYLDWPAYVLWWHEWGPGK